MRRNTSVSLGDYFEDFVESRISEGRFKNASEVIRAGLRLLEVEENRIKALRNAIQVGIDSGIAKNSNDKTYRLKDIKSGHFVIKTKKNLEILLKQQAITTGICK